MSDPSGPDDHARPAPRDALPPPQVPYTFDHVFRMGVTACGAIALFLLLRYLSDVLVPFAAAAVLAYLLNPLVSAFEHKTGRRWLAVLITLVGTVIVGVALFVAVGVFSVRQYDHLVGTLERVRAGLQPAPGDLPPPPPPPDVGGGDAEPPSKTALGWRELKAGWRAYRETADSASFPSRVRALVAGVEGTVIGDALQRLGKYLGKESLALNLGKLLVRGGRGVVAAGASVIVALTVAVLVVLYLVFLLMDYPRYARAAREAIPPRYRTSVLEFAAEFEVALGRYFRGQTLVALCVGLLFTVGFVIVDLPLAVPFGLAVGALNLVPYLQTVAIPPACALGVLRAVEHDSSLATSIVLVLAVFAVVQFFQDAVLTPRILGRATGLRPVAILLGVFIWGKLLGFLGLLLAIPLTCLGIAYYRRLVLKDAPEATRLSGG